MERKFVVAQNNDKPHFPRLLICEGLEDLSFFRLLIEARKLPRFHLQSSGGRFKPGGNTKFRSAIQAFRIEKPKIFDSLGDIVLVADNDDMPSGNFKKVCQQIDQYFGAGTAPPAPLQPTKTQPRVTILMIPWEGEHGHLESLCVESARCANKNIGRHVNDFMALIHSEKWRSESRVGKAKLRISLAARCESDPFVPLKHVFDDPKHHTLIPLTHASFNRIADFLSTFAQVADGEARSS